MGSAPLRIATIALAVALGSGCASTWDAAVPTRTVRLLVAVDGAYRFHAGWEGDLRATVESVSGIFARRAGVRFETVRIVTWQAPPLGDGRALEHLATIPAADADVVVGVSGGCDHTHAGSAQLFSRVALATTGCVPFLQKRAPTLQQLLTHELAHVFGAFHPAPGVRSVMRGGAADDWDSQTLRVVRLMRGLDFARGVDDLDQATRDAYSRIYAEGHDPADAHGLAVAVRNRGRLLAEAGTMDVARDRFMQAIALDPAWHQPYYDLGVWHARHQQPVEAARFLRQAADRAGRAGPEVRLAIAGRLDALGDREAALRLYEETASAAPTSAAARLQLGAALLRRNRAQDAEPHLREAVRLAPASAEAWQKLVAALVLGRRYAEAWAEVQRAAAAGVVIPPSMQEHVRRELGAGPAPPR
jgi:tetratricopeptide (TPR) repeat protein